MWYCPEKYKTDSPEDINKVLSELKGQLEGKEAKISLAKFLNSNIGLTTELISGIKLAPYQEITLKGMMESNFSMCVWGRGVGKTFAASIFCFLQCIFNPETKILIAGPTFRTARFVFNNLEKIVDSKEAKLLAQCFGAKSKRNDQFEWLINGGSITAIPLSGEKIRGFRANVLVLDEFLLLPEDIIKTVLMPFLVAPQDMKERIKIREMEDKLIKSGKMKESDRIEFKNNSKMIALSSASYTFENLYKTYKDWTTNIYSKDIVGDTRYFISQLAWDSIPDHMVDETVIEEAQSGGSSNSVFQREYCAQFTDGSDSYFSAKKMHECTVEDGSSPTASIVGSKDKKYEMGIDPSFSNSPSSDYFAMSIIELDEETQTGTLVHNYAVAGGDLKDHINYMTFVIDHFNIVLVVIDNAGYQFIDSCNEADKFKRKLKFIDFNSDAEGLDYENMIKKAKRQYNQEDGAICFKQVFTASYIRKANEHLQASIDHKKIWFASRCTANASEFNKFSNKKVPLKSIDQDSIIDFIEGQDALIYQVKKQCALVEVKSTAKGTQTFDLPQHLKRNTSANRARKDNYTTLMLGNWGVKSYFDIISCELKNYSDTFAPRLI